MRRILLVLTVAAMMAVMMVAMAASPALAVRPVHAGNGSCESSNAGAHGDDAFNFGEHQQNVAKAPGPASIAQDTNTSGRGGGCPQSFKDRQPG